MQDNLFEQIEKYINDPSNSEDASSKLFSNEELDAIIVSYANNHEEFTEEDVFFAVRWCEDAMIRYGLLQMVIAGDLFMTYTGDQDDFLFQKVDK